MKNIICIARPGRIRTYIPVLFEEEVIFPLNINYASPSSRIVHVSKGYALPAAQSADISEEFLPTRRIA